MTNKKYLRGVLCLMLSCLANSAQSQITLFCGIGCPAPAQDIKSSTGIKIIYGTPLRPALPHMPGKALIYTPGKSDNQYQHIIKKYSMRYSIPERLINAIIAVESGFNPHAVSKAGAKGLMQLMPSVYRDADPFNPEQNIMLGVKQLAYLRDTFNGSIDLMLAGYNAGERNVLKHHGVPPFDETINYLKKINSIIGDNQINHLY